MDADVLNHCARLKRPSDAKPFRIRLRSKILRRLRASPQDINNNALHTTLINVIMVKFYESSFNYDYPFPAVSLAYFLRYPNPYATHVISTDVIDRHLDPDTRRLTTTRLHLKRSKIPLPVLKLLPKGILGSGGDSGKSFVLETSVVDAKEGWMETETKNLEWTGILSVVERQLYQRAGENLANDDESRSLVERTRNEGTGVTTTVTLLSRFGQARKLKWKSEANATMSSPSEAVPEDEEAPKKSWISTWTTSSLQRTIEMMGLKRTREAMGKSKEGMNVVLSRYRSGGLKQVLEGMQEDRQRAYGQNGPWKQAWRQGQDVEEEH